MNFYVLTLFPDMILSGINHSIIKRAIEKECITINCVNIRDFAGNKHNKVDDYPYGGGAGMVMQPQPIYDAYKSVEKQVKQGAKVCYMTPQGKPFNQKKAIELSEQEDIILLCGHYEGIDERVIEEIVTDEISLGDFILTGGELAAMIIIDATTRLLDNVLGKEESHQDESFSNNLLEYPHYTRPSEFLGKSVPDVLLSGHHKNIDQWRLEQSLLRTKSKRPDLLRS